MIILGFADFIPKTMPLLRGSLFIIPFFFWLVALYYSLQVMLTRHLDLHPHSLDDIRKKSEQCWKRSKGNYDGHFGSSPLA